jgi:HK97 family phage portal protein
MAIFGLMTKKEAQAVAEAAVKAAMLKDAPRWLLETADAERYNLPDPSIFGNQADLYRKLTTVTQAVDITSSAGAVAKFSVYKTNGDQEPEDIANHPFERLLRHPNPLDSRYEFLKATISSWMLNGNAYWWLNRPSPTAPADELWVIPPHMIQPIPDSRMFLDGYYYYPGNGVEMALPVHEIVHFKRYNPFSRFVGLSAIEAVAVTAMGLLGMEQWNTKLFAENNARLPGILAFKQMIDDGVWEKIKADTREAANKREMMMLRGVGEGGIDWKQNAVSQKEMEFLAGIEAGDKKIMDTLAPGLYTWLSGESTYSNANANRAAFNELTLYPMHTMMGEGITKHILTTYAKNSPSPERTLMGSFEDVRISDKQLELAEIAEYAKTHTVEEVRQKYYGDQPLGDDRDKLLVAQINAQSGGIQEPPPSPFADRDQNPNNDMTKKPEQAKDDKPEKPEEPKADEAKEEASKAALDDLDRYRRKALKRVGQAVEFTSDLLPSPIMDMLGAKLPTCTSETAVKALFDAARGELKPKAKTQPNDAAMVLEGLRLALKALELRKG